MTPEHPLPPENPVTPDNQVTPERRPGTQQGLAAGQGLAAQQAAVVAAVTGTGPPPAGFDSRRVDIARRALLAKRAGEIRTAWPELARSLGAEFAPLFAQWAARRPTGGALADGYRFARSLRSSGRLGPAAELELAEHGVSWVFPDGARPRVRRLPALKRCPGGFVAGWRGRVVRCRRRPR